MEKRGEFSFEFKIRSIGTAKNVAIKKEEIIVGSEGVFRWVSFRGPVTPGDLRTNLNPYNRYIYTQFYRVEFYYEY